MSDDRPRYDLVMMADANCNNCGGKGRIMSIGAILNGMPDGLCECVQAHRLSLTRTGLRSEDIDSQKGTNHEQPPK